MPVLSRYIWNRGLISCLIACAGRRWRLGRTWDIIGSEAARTRGNHGDINRGLRLLPLVSRLNALGPTWFLAAYGLAFFLLS